MKSSCTGHFIKFKTFKTNFFTLCQKDSLLINVCGIAWYIEELIIAVFLDLFKNYGRLAIMFPHRRPYFAKS